MENIKHFKLDSDESFSFIIYKYKKDLIKAWKGEDDEPLPIEMTNYIKLYKCWGFCENECIIHLWFYEATKIEHLIMLIGHELGHTKRPFYKKFEKEESKANNYAEVALLAFKLAAVFYHTKDLITEMKGD